MKHMLRLKLETLSSEFKVDKVLRQGYAIAPLLFNVVLELQLEVLK
jgi:hypothetical protein